MLTKKVLTPPQNVVHTTVLIPRIFVRTTVLTLKAVVRTTVFTPKLLYVQQFARVSLCERLRKFAQHGFPNCNLACVSLRALAKVCLKRISELQSGLRLSASACEGMLKLDFRIAIEMLRPPPGTPAAAAWGQLLL